MQQLLSGKKRLKGFSGEWKEFVFSDIAKRINRKNTELNDTVVTISAQRGFVLQEDFFNKRVASDTLLNYTLVHKGEYCYNKSYSNGYPMGAFKRLDAFDKAVVTTLYICFSLKEKVDTNFMNQCFDAGKMIPELMKIAQEGGRAHGLLNISLSDFFGLKLKIPNKDEQIAIATILINADEEIEILNKKLFRFKEQKKGLMQQLLTGKKRLKF
ncbi:restriction endonuclease subunit S [Yeosuana marina]|uniref:restriction endonuclease subunit S n=1 Tax=Yeosuana marina TaxID=1565536 RepID=UPI0030C7F5B3